MVAYDQNLRSRALRIEEIVCRDYADDGTDAADLALEELHRNSNRSDDDIALMVAVRLAQS